jgi:hypothetical protein
MERKERVNSNEQCSTVPQGGESGEHTSAAQATARAELAQTLESTCAEAADAHTSVGALVEILSGCGPEKQITAHLFLGLLIPIRAELESVRDGLRVMCQAEGMAL